jgi:hypothetical protein
MHVSVMKQTNTLQQAIFEELIWCTYSSPKKKSKYFGLNLKP